MIFRRWVVSLSFVAAAVVLVAAAAAAAAAGEEDTEEDGGAGADGMTLLDLTVGELLVVAASPPRAFDICLFPCRSK
jgi:hypothetical protein